MTDEIVTGESIGNLVEDAYAAHVRALREREEHVKMATLRLEADEMAAVALFLHDVLKSLPEGQLTNAQVSTWNRILRAVNQSVVDAV